MKLMLSFSLLLVTISGLGASQNEAEVVASSHFPARLTEDSLRDSADGFQPRRYVSAVRSGDWIFAAYSNGYIGAIRVLRFTGTEWTLVAEEIPANMSGRSPDVELHDLDGEDHPEVLVSLEDQFGAATYWIFRWDGSSLALLNDADRSPVTGVDSDIINAVFVDVDGDGTKEVISCQIEESDVEPDGTRTVIDRLKLYRFSGGKLVEGPTPLFAHRFEGERRPDVRASVFVVEDLSVEYAVRVINVGSAHAAASIAVNGVPVFTPEDFGVNWKVLGPRKISTVEDVNSVVVQPTGTRGSAMFIMVEPRP